MFSKILFNIQDRLRYFYDSSMFLQHIDEFIFASVLLVLVSSVFLTSDSIGFIALVTMFLTFVKLLTKPQEKFTFNKFEIFLITYFMLVIISLAG